MEKHIDSINEIFSSPPKWLMDKWQEIAELLGNVLKVPSALIMRVDNEELEVFASSKSKENPYKKGSKLEWQGFYSEAMIKSQKKLIVTNALKNDRWASNPSVKKGLISYLGYPINFSDDTIFGVICVLDNKEKNFTKKCQELMIRFKRIIEEDLLQIDFFGKEKKILNDKIYQQYQDLAEKNKTLIAVNEEAKYSQLKYKLISNITSEGIMLHDKGIIKEVNKSFEKITGYTRKELIGENCLTFVEDKFKEKVSENIRKGISSTYEIEIIKKGGTNVFIELEAKNIKTESGKVAYAVAIRDISSYKKKIMEVKKFSTAIEQSSNTVVITNLNGTIEYVNPAFTKISGYTYDEAVGNNPRILNSGLQPKEYYLKLWNKIRNGETWKGEFCNKAKDGRLYWENVTITPITDENGKIIYYLGIKEDITERKTAEKEIRRKNEELLIAKERAEKSDRLKSEFLASISHEIRTPLNAIVGFSNIIAEESKNEQFKKFSKIIHNQNEALLQIVNDILDFSQFEVGAVEIQNQKFDINSVVEEIYSLYKHKCPAQVKLIAKTTSKPIIVNSDQRRLTQIFNNLISNALKFTEKGEIVFGFEEKENSKIIGFVKDTGIGIKKEKQAEIFESFTKLDKFSQGTGLGLSIVKSIIRALGGAVWLESEYKKGSNFYFKIPFKKIRKAKEAEHHKTTEIDTNTKVNPILIVEDQKSNFAYLKELLNSKGLQVLHASNGKQAIEICKKNKNISLILMDVKMPLLDGYEATKQIKKIYPKLPIVIQTAYASEEDKQKAKEIGCDGYLSKPIDKKILDEILIQYLLKNK